MESKITAYAQYQFESSAKAGASNTTITDDEKKTFDSKTTENLKVVGGKAEYGQFINQQDNYNKWIASLDNNSNLVLCDFSKSSLVPIWELCDDVNRKNLLEKAFNDYAAGKQIPNMDASNCITDLKIVGGGSGAVKVDQGYNLINSDLNNGVGGDFIYIEFKNGLDNSTNPYPITALTAVKGENAQAPEGYTKLDYDLNKNAGGEYIYLCYKREPNKPAIRDIKVLSGENTKSDLGYTYVT